MAITWYQDSGDIIVPNQKKEETNNGIVLFILPKTAERFLLGWTHDLNDISNLFNSNDGSVSGLPEGGGNEYYLADKPNIEIKKACWKDCDNGGNEYAYMINLHVFRLLDENNIGGGGGGSQVAE